MPGNRGSAVGLKLAGEIAHQINQAVDLEPLFLKLVRLVATEMGYSRVAIGLLKDEEICLQAVARREWEEAGRLQVISSALRFPSGIGITGHAVATRRTVVVTDVSQTPWKESDYPLASKRGAALAIPLVWGDRTVGVMDCRSAETGGVSSAEQHLLEILAAQVAMAVENTRLRKSLQSERETLMGLSNRLLELEEQERRAIAERIHDGIGQTLSALGLHLEILKGFCEQTPKARELLTNAEALVRHGITFSRQLSADLRPPSLDNLGLVPTLKWTLRTLGQKINAQVICQVDPPQLILPAELEISVYRIIKEALLNIERHARATQITLRMYRCKHRLTLEVQDNGVGFDIQAVAACRKAGQGLGLVVMEERVAGLGGSCQIISKPGQGTRIKIQIPIRSDKQEVSA